MNRNYLIALVVVISCCFVTESRIHHLSLTNDIRRYFVISKFGYLTGGELTVHLTHFSTDPWKEDDIFGFTLARTTSDSLSPYIEGHERSCSLLNSLDTDDSIDVISMKFNFAAKNVTFDCSPLLERAKLIDLTKPRPDKPRDKRDIENSHDPKSISDEQNDPKNLDPPSSKETKNSVLPEVSDVANKKGDDGSVSEPKKILKRPGVDAEHPLIAHPGIKPVTVKVIGNVESESQTVPQPAFKKSSCSIVKQPFLLNQLPQAEGVNNEHVYTYSFKMLIEDPQLEGLYTLFFHSCPNYDLKCPFGCQTKVNLSIDIIESNLVSYNTIYLSAGEIPLPEIYFALSVVFFILGFVWVQVVRSKKEEAFKIHYLMALLVFVKAFALLFHGINFHFISTVGSQIETWAVLYYMTHVLKGALLFITIVLIGTGWAFIKHILSDKDKRLFAIVIPLQVLANVAEIIVDESEEGEMKHNMWKEVFILVDLLCCGCILFPVVWSIKHLQEASHIDGKAAINLKKLKLFRRFYVMVVCYIYFTRIIVYLLKITLPFQYEWMDVFIQHVAILFFFVLTGYHFQPTPQNPYFRLNTFDNEDLEMEEVLFEITPNSYTGGLSKKKKNKSLIVEVDPEDDGGEGGWEQQITKRESSHDFD